MVRINLIPPTFLADQHVIAEYNEILMLLGYVRKYPEKKNIPPQFTLGKGHIIFFKDKLLYLKKRHELLKKEMQKRGFVTEKTIELEEFPVELHNDWKPQEEDVMIIKNRLKEKVRMKPTYYRYCGEYKDVDFFIALIEKA